MAKPGAAWQPPYPGAPTPRPKGSAGVKVALIFVVLAVLVGLGVLASVLVDPTSTENARNPLDEVGPTIVDTAVQVTAYAYNGFSVPITITVDGTRYTVPPEGHKTLGELPAETVAFTAQLQGTDEPFETLEADLTDLGGKAFVYNIAGRGAIGYDYILYSESGRTPEDEGALFLGKQLCPIPNSIDYLFVEPPEEKVLVVDVTNTCLFVEEDCDVYIAIDYLVEMEEIAEMLHFMRVEMQITPEDFGLAQYAIRSIDGNEGARREFALECRDRAPHVAGFHYIYIDLFAAEDSAAIIDEYEALLDANPDSAQHHYLLALTLGVVNLPRACELLERAVELDGDFADAYYDLGQARATLAGC